MHGQDFINMIKSFYPQAKVVSGNTEIVLRCKSCGDSKDLSHAHLYISVPRTDKDISLYHCKKCNSSGIVDDKFLRQYGCDDTSILINMAQHINQLKSIPQYTYLKNIKRYPLKNMYISNQVWNTAKLSYINTRLGTQFNYDDILNLKIFFNLNDILISNKLEPSRDPYIINHLIEHFIGFISYDNKYAIMRQYDNSWLPKSINYRYINYKIIETIDTSKAYYVIPTKIDLADPNIVNIHIAEGVFDILSIYANLNKCNTYQNIYIACAGKSYLQALKFILSETGLINYNVHFYPDKDVNDAYFNYSILKSLDLLTYGTIYVHRNTYSNEKDYGVPMEHIKDYVRVINEKII